MSHSQIINSGMTQSKNLQHNEMAQPTCTCMYCTYGMTQPTCTCMYCTCTCTCMYKYMYISHSQVTNSGMTQPTCTCMYK